MASLFKPVLVNNKDKFDEDTIPKIDGQYIIIADSKEIYIDEKIGENIERKRVNKNIYIQSGEPVNPIVGDIWIVTEENNNL